MDVQAQEIADDKRLVRFNHDVSRAHHNWLRSLSIFDVWKICKPAGTQNLFREFLRARTLNF